jgi:hypothetical protein
MKTDLLQSEKKYSHYVRNKKLYFRSQPISVLLLGGKRADFYLFITSKNASL